MEDKTLIGYLNTFCNWIKLISLNTKKSTLLVKDGRTRALFYLINSKKIEEEDYPYIYVSQICTLCINYHNEILYSQNIIRKNQLKSICKEIYIILLNYVSNSKIDFNNYDIVKSTNLFQKSTNIIKDYFQIEEYDVEVEDISCFI